MSRPKPTKLPALLALLPLLIGCAVPSMHDLSDSVAGAALNQNDVGIVREGLPAYLLMIDGLIDEDPEDTALLTSGARLYAFYAVNLVTDNARSRTLTEKARSYARKALCLKQPKLCNIDAQAFDEFKMVLQQVAQDDLNELYVYGLCWAAWLQAHSRDWNALADRPKIEALFERVVEIDERYDFGRAHYYMGMLRSQLSPALGGKAEIGKEHFERAIAISQGRDLAVKVALAKYYARMIYDRELHDRLLREVLEADPDVSGLTLSNTMAQQDAKRLLDESSSYFQE